MIVGSAIGPTHLRSVAEKIESSGFDELWLAEDFFFTGGIAGAATCLAATNQITVGLGVVSAVARHPALLAMELSTLAGVHPGRLVAGIGLGVPAWIDQMGLTPPSALSAVAECVAAIRALLAGEELTERGRTCEFKNVRLTYPLEDDLLPVHIGGIGPNMLELSGRIADGSVLSVLGGTDYIRWARQRVEAGRYDARRTRHHQLTAFALCSVDEDGERARDAVRGPLAFYLSAGGPNALTDLAGISGELQDIIDRGDSMEQSMPDSWLESLTVAGTPSEVVTKIEAFFDAGADSVGLLPTPVERVGQMIELTAGRVLPALRD